MIASPAARQNPRGTTYREVSSDDESVGHGLRLALSNCNSDDSEDDDEDAAVNHTQRPPLRHKPPRPSAMAPRASLLPKASSQRRRRSSAHFLNLGQGGESSQSRARQHSRKSLAVMYKNVIRMNTENKINSGNSWNLKLIENLDQFLTEEDDNEDDPENNHGANNSNSNHQARDASGEKRVNFTKASCTLDASVKIYGYRVDDVHLTSYKVLHNLHRSDTNNHNKKGRKKGGADDNDKEANDAEGNGTTVAAKKKTHGPTVESNHANINLSKLDFAYDIDPLFHKMSKTFDEGGAKGLLLANLGVGSNDCNIVFDTSSSNADIGEENEEANGEGASQETMDISLLQEKLKTSMGENLLESFSLVEQLADLRLDCEQLDQEGFVDTEVPLSRTQRYAAEHEEEIEADRSIHQEALERSRVSLGRSFAMDENSSPQGQSFALGGFDDADDDDDGGFGGFGGDDDDDDFGDFMAADDQGVARISGISLAGSVKEATREGKQTSKLLDAIATGKIMSNSDYEYLDRQALSQVAGNAWAGASHWRPVRKSKQKATTKDATETGEEEGKGKKKTTKKKTTRNKKQTFVDLTCTPDMTEVLKMPPKPKGRGRSRADPLQFTKTMVEKHTNADNLLPQDASITVRDFSRLFLLPEKFADDFKSAPEPSKAVAFDMGGVETFEAGGGDWDDGSFGGGGDDDYEGGFTFAGGDEEETGFASGGLEDVRRVEKIRVAYASKAKKVDVKRLKRDLWTEVETQLSHAPAMTQDNEEEVNQEEEDLRTPTKSKEPLSFYDTVQEMEQNKSQPDVSLPFYFICMLHLANEKNLRLESQGLESFLIFQDGQETSNNGDV